MNIYDNHAFFDAYAQMSRSQDGLAGAGEWHQLQPLFPPLAGKAVLDLGCGYGWHCKYAAENGAAQVLGIDDNHKKLCPLTVVFIFYTSQGSKLLDFVI